MTSLCLPHGSSRARVPVSASAPRWGLSNHSYCCSLLIPNHAGQVQVLWTLLLKYPFWILQPLYLHIGSHQQYFSSALQSSGLSGLPASGAFPLLPSPSHCVPTNPHFSGFQEGACSPLSLPLACAVSLAKNTWRYLVLHSCVFCSYKFNHLQIRNIENKNCICNEQTQTFGGGHYSINNAVQQLFTQCLCCIRYCK